MLEKLDTGKSLENSAKRSSEWHKTKSYTTYEVSSFTIIFSQLKL